VRLCLDLIGLQMGYRPLAGWAWVLKGILDRVAAAIILLLTASLLLGVALAIRLSSPGPVFFRQKRYGLNGRPIEVLKFRTMHLRACDDGASEVRQVERGDPRVTPLGRLLRQTSLDELPQFLNVLRGDMSIVGPRPHAVAHDERYARLIDAYPARHRVKPGITGWAQVNGFRGPTPMLQKMEQRLEHDLYYIENWSLSLDLSIILRTLFVGFRHPNAF
jgi:putative colanic acid biosynthesis UDP-glucose lipid carrier transferase